MLEKKIGRKNNELYSFGSFRLHPGERRLTRDGAVVALTGKTLDLLVLLVEQAGRLLTRAELIEALWPTTVVEEHNLTWNVSVLRKALGDEGETARYIETVRGQGYRFIAPVTVEAEPVRRFASLARRRAALAAAAIVVAVAIAATAVLAVRLAGQAGPAASGVKSDPFHTVAVLPFANLSADPDNAYFASGIQDTILTKLSGISGLRVISRTSTERYPSHPTDMKTVAAQLGASAVLEGSVQKSGKQVLINAQLIDARTDLHLWAQIYTRTLDDVFEVERDVAEQVAAALKTKLLPAEAARVARAPTADSRAYDLFLRAEYLATAVEEGTSKTPVAAVAEGADLYRQAIAQDPGFALAHARLSYLESYAWWFDLDHTPARIAGAEQAARRALELEPDLLQAHLAMGYVHYWSRRDYAAALTEFERAYAGLPSNPDVIAAIAFIHRRQGRWDEALAGLQRTTTLDPRNPRWFLSLGDTLADLRRYAEAVAAYDRGLAIEPKDYNTAGRRIWTLFAAGEDRRAREALAAIPVDVDPEGMLSALRFEAAWLARDADAALAALAHAPAMVQVPLAVGEMPASLLRGNAWALKGDAERARAAYEEARATLTEALRKHPDHADLLSMLGRAEAGLGHKEEAVRAGRRAAERLPLSKDALYGLVYRTALAEIHARTGDADAAIDLLRELLTLPAGVFVSPALLKADPSWDRLRADPRFAALLEAQP